MAIPKRTRFEVLQRDNHTCRYCRSTEGQLTVDHVTPVALGGTDDPSNLVAACRDCNAGKASSNPDEATVAQVQDDALRWAAAMQRASDDRRAKRASDAEPQERFLAKWMGAIGVGLPSNWRTSITRFLDAGLTIDELEDYVDTTWNRVDAHYESDFFRYFCGIAWRSIKELRDRAEQILAEEASGSA